MNPLDYDVIIVGGGPAGLSAALWLARYRRRIRVLDSDEPRNEPAWGVHGYPGLVDPSPTELRERIHQQAINAGAEYEACEAVALRGSKNEFLVQVANGTEYRARRVIIAYGLRDTLPDITGAEELYGISLFHCADCDGPTIQDQDVGVVGWDRHAATLALYLLTWTSSVSLLFNGKPSDLSAEALDTLRDNGIAVHKERADRLRTDDDGRLCNIELEAGRVLPAQALFFHLGSQPRCDLAEQVGCARDDDGYLSVDRGQETTVPGLYAAGDITGHPHLASVAAAEGVRAALTIHRSLLPAERKLSS
jgi:thioredoxin reductase